MDCHTLVTAIAPVTQGQRPQVIKAYSEDISVGGARLISPVALPGKRIYLKFLLPHFGDRFVEAEVVSEQVRERRWMNGQVIQLNVYGLKFTGAMADGAVFQELINADDAESRSEDRE